MQYRFYLTLLIVLIVYNQSISQSPKDTSTWDDLMIYETQVVKEGVIHDNTLKLGFELLRIEESECDKSSDPYRIKKRIISKSYDRDTLNITVATSANCGGNFYANLEVKGDTLNLLFDQLGELVYCSCCFSLSYKIKLPNKNDFKFMLNNQLIDISDDIYWKDPIKFEVEPDGDTINYVNEYGCYLGVHKYYTKKGKIKALCKYDKVPKYELCYNYPIEPNEIYEWTYHKNGIVKTFKYYEQNQLRIYKEYTPVCILQKVCIDGNCEEN